MYQYKLFLKVSSLLILFFPVFLSAQTADLELTMTADNPQVAIYDYITITTSLENAGSQSVDNVVIRFDIPMNVAIAGEFPPVAQQGSYEGFYGGSDEGNWFVGTVAAGQTLTFEVTLFNLSANSTTFYGQVFQGDNNDADSTPGNGTCCTANEDDEGAYTFPNDGITCSYSEAYAELICDENGTPNDQSDNFYTLRFRADGTLDGMFNVSIPALGYNQTSAYSIGFIELTDIGLGTENLELIFSDAEGTANCGETLIVTAPPCGGFPPFCEIIYNEISNTIDDMGTPDNPFDDTFTIVYTIENAGGGTGFVGQFGGQFCGSVPSTGTYGEEMTFTANVANWGNGSPVGCQIIDNENPDCTGGYVLLPAVDCGFGNVCSDLELTAAATPTPGASAPANAQFSLHNDFLGEDATGIQVTFNKNELNTVGVPTVSQGSIDLYWTDNPVWNVGSLASNQMATIDFDLFTLAANYSIYGQVTMQNENDYDSTPNNGNGTSPIEDDEAIYGTDGGTNPLAELIIENLVISNSPAIPGDILLYSFNVTNQGELAVNTATSIRAWISTDDVLSADDLAGGQAFSQAAIAAGETTISQAGQSSLINTLADGDYFLILEIDEFDVVQEANENNNTMAAPFTIDSDSSCDLTISDIEFRCANEAPNAPFVYSIEVAGAVGNTVYYEVLETNFSGTIIVGQLVDIATLPQGLDFTILVIDPNNFGCDYTLTPNIVIEPGGCGGGECTVEITEFVRSCVENDNPSSDISITATAISSTGNPMNVLVNGTDVGTIESGISTEIYTTGQGAYLNISFTDVDNPDCTVETSSFPGFAPNECADVSCNIFEPQISNLSCTETTTTFDILVTGQNLSDDLQFRAEGEEIAIVAGVATTITIPRTSATTEALIIDLGFSGNQFQDFCLRPFNIDCIPTNSGADVTLSVSNSTNTPDGAYQAGEALFTLTNTGTTAASGLTVTFTKNQVNITGTPSTTIGTPQSHWTDNPVWQVGTLAPGQSEIIVFPVFTVGEDFSIYAEVTAMAEEDIDSTPNNGNGSTPVEDDESLWIGGDIPIQLPDLVLTDIVLNVNSTEIGGTIDYSFNIENQGDAPNINMSGFVFSGLVTSGDLEDSYFTQGTELVTDVLNPGQSISRSGTFTLNNNIPDGYNYFAIIVDGGNNVTESNEDNNLYSFGPYLFNAENNPCVIDLELVNIECTEAEGFYDLTVAMNAVNLAPPFQTYTILNGEFLGVAFTQDSDVRTFFDIPLSQVTEINTYDPFGPCIEGSLVVEVEPDTDCDVVAEGVDLELSVSVSEEVVPIYGTYSVTYTLTNAGNADATGISIRSPRHPAVVFEGGNEYSASQGDLNFFSPENAFWDVGSLAAGATATLTMNLYAIDTGTVPNYAFVMAQNEPDFDSTPNEWLCCIPVEDDEAGITVMVSPDIIINEYPVLFSINAYPVPTQEYLTVEISSELAETANLEVLDVNGRAQISQEIIGVKGVQTIKISVADLEKGIYLLSVREGGENVVQRFVKM